MDFDGINMRCVSMCLLSRSWPHCMLCFFALNNPTEKLKQSTEFTTRINNKEKENDNQLYCFELLEMQLNSHIPVKTEKHKKVQIQKYYYYYFFVEFSCTFIYCLWPGSRRYLVRWLFRSCSRLSLISSLFTLFFVVFFFSFNSLSI